MSRCVKILCAVIASFAFLFIGIGYAEVADILNIGGQASYVMPDGLVISAVSVLEGESSATSSVSSIYPTNVKSTISGVAGQKVVYKITAKNYSPTYKYYFDKTEYEPTTSPLGANVSIKVYSDVSEDSSGNKIYSFDDIVYPKDDSQDSDEITFYAEYTLTDTITDGEILIKYDFNEFIYMITYKDGDTLLEREYIVDNASDYKITKTATKAGENFESWVSASSVSITVIPSKNTNDYTLYANWANKHVVRFVDTDGTVLYQEEFAQGNSSISSAGTRRINEILNELQNKAGEDLSVEWESYNLSTAKSDITVRALYTYKGNLNLQPVDENGDGTTDYYRVESVASLGDIVNVPGKVNGIPVKEVEKLTADRWDNTKTIKLGEGVAILREESLAGTPDLSDVSLPSTLERIEKKAFSSNVLGLANKKITFTYNGTKEMWDNISKLSGWDQGLADGTVIICTDGVYTLKRSWSNYSWSWSAN